MEEILNKLTELGLITVTIKEDNITYNTKEFSQTIGEHTYYNCLIIRIDEYDDGSIIFERGDGKILSYPFKDFHDDLKSGKLSFKLYEPDTSIDLVYKNK